MSANQPLVVLGCGYIGSRLARAALAQGRQVRACARGTAKLEPLRALGAEIKYVDAGQAKQFGPALLGVTGATVVYGIPPQTQLPPGEALRRATQAALNGGARCFIYLSSAGLYGDHPSEDVIDELVSPALDDPNMSAYQKDEGAVETAAMAGLHTVILRLAAVYGPERGVRARLRKGNYKLLDDGVHWISRVHVDDLVRLIFAIEDKAPQSATYLVADDAPTRQREYAEWLCARLGLPVPASQLTYAPGMPRVAHRGRRIKNDKVKAELGFQFLYPTYKEGEAQIDAEEGGAAPVVPAPAPAPAAVVAPVAAPPGVPRPEFIRNLSTLKEETWNYPGSTEPMSRFTALAREVGLKRFGVDLVRVLPGTRSGWPHAHSAEDEFLYVLEGTPDVWIDGHLHRLGVGDVVGFPANTGVGHIIINNSQSDVRMLVVGENREGQDKVYYPLHPERQASLAEARRWDDVPKPATPGPHDGLPDAARKK